MHTDPLHPWSGIDMHFLKVEQDVFHASTKVVIGNWSMALF
jgi:hypothetical protein